MIARLPAVVPWVGFVCIVLLVLNWFFRFTMRVHALIAGLTNRTPSVNADVDILFVDAANLNADADANAYDRYAGQHNYIQHRASGKGG